MLRRFLMILAFVVLGGPSMAVEPGEMLADPVLEARAREVSKGLRCVVCQNQNIDDSNAGIARDMRLVLRERILAGDSNTQAQQYIVDRFGSFVLLKPPVTPVTYVLWVGPLVLLILTTLGFAMKFRRRPGPHEEQKLSARERKIIDRLLSQEAAK